jgi:hypothetical protein
MTMWTDADLAQFGDAQRCTLQAPAAMAHSTSR